MQLRKKKTKKRDNIVIKILKILGFMALFYLGMFVVTFIYMGTMVLNYKILSIHFIINRVIPFIIVNVLLAVIGYRIYSTIKYFIDARYGVTVILDQLDDDSAENIISLFMRIVYNVYLVTYMFTYVIMFSKDLFLWYILKPFYPYIRWINLFDILLVVIAALYCCFTNDISNSAYVNEQLNDEQRLLRKKIINNDQYRTFIMRISCMLIFFLSDGFNYTIKFYLTCFILDVTVSIFESLKIKNGAFENEKTGKTYSVWFRLFAMLMLNAVFFASVIIYTNTYFGVQRVKSFSTIIQREDYTYRHHTKGGNSYSLYIEDPATHKTYDFDITAKEYHSGIKKIRTVKVVVYKGLWGFQWADYEE